MSMFGKIAGASASGGGNWLRDGQYKFLVESVTLDKKYSGEVFIAEMRVIEATPTGDLDEKGNPVVPNKVGSNVSLICNLTKHDSAAGNAKAFALGVLGALGYVEEQITEQVMTEMCDRTKNPLRGMAVGCNTRRTINQGKLNPANRGKVLTLPSWYSITQAPEQIKAQRAYLDGTKPGSDVVAATTAAAPAAVATTSAAATVAAPPVLVAPATISAPAPNAGILSGILGQQ